MIHDTNCHLLTTSRTNFAFLHKYDIQIKLLSQNKVITCAFVHLHYQIALQQWQLLQEEGLRVDWQLNQDSSMEDRRTRDLEVRV